jgi:hypothetical protein
MARSQSPSILYGPTQRRILRVGARAMSADLKKEIEIDVTGYLLSLPEEDLEEMAAAGWRRVDGIKGALLWCDRNRDWVARGLIEYCKDREQSFSVIFDADAADDWLSARL